jgi:dienelactone hydrolase
VHDIVFANSQKTYTAAYRVCPVKANKAAAILYVHWYDPSEPTSNRSQFLNEAKTLAKRGVCSLLVDTMWSQPDYFPGRDPAKDETNTRRQRDRLKDALDFLLSWPEIDTTKVAYVGHDFGGMYGALLAGEEKRVNAWAIQAAAPAWSDWYLLGSKATGADRDAIIAKTAALDPAVQLKKAQGAFLFQFADNDRYVPADRIKAIVDSAPEPKQLIMYPQAGHGLNQKAVDDRVAWLTQQLISPQSR